MAEVTVVVPTFNRASLICETLEAVIGQTLPADQIIVVDDGSTDDTGAVVAAFGQRVQLVQIENSGELVARNVGLRAAGGSLVAFCDSDDVWRPDFLETMSAQWVSDPRLVAAYSDFTVLSAGSRSGRTKFSDAPDGFWSDLRETPSGGVFERELIARLLEFQPFFPSCMMVSRARFLDIGGWDEGVSRIVGCDFATVLRVAAHPPLGVVFRPLVAIRKHAGNFSGDIQAMNLGDARVLDHVLRTRPEASSHEAAMRLSMAQRRMAALDEAFSRRDFAAVRNIYRLLPPASRSAKSVVKRAIASLPHPADVIVSNWVSRGRPFFGR